MAGALHVLPVIELTFDPLLRIGEMTIRWQTLGVLGALLVGFAVAAMMAPNLNSQRLVSRRPRPDLAPRFPEAPVVDPSVAIASGRPLRLDDMITIIAAIVPGAVVGGRLVHAIDYWDAYADTPSKVLDPSVGALSLLGAVIGGLVTAVYVGYRIGAPVRRWADAAAVPFLLVIGLGKLAQLLGGSGQGVPFDGSWAVAFAGGGPWVSANAHIASHPSQVYEALWILIGIPIVLLLAGQGRRPAVVNGWVARADRVNDDGRLFVTALSWFLLGRVLVGFTWRDEPTVGPLNSEQALALAAFVGVGLGFRLRARRPHLRTSASASSRPTT